MSLKRRKAREQRIADSREQALRSALARARSLDAAKAEAEQERRPGEMPEDTLVWCAALGRMVRLWEARAWTKSAVNNLDFPTAPPPEELARIEAERREIEAEEAEAAAAAEEQRRLDCERQKEREAETMLMGRIGAVLAQFEARLAQVEQMRAERREIEAGLEVSPELPN